MRVVVCPDKFAGTLSAAEVAAAIAEGWLAAAPADEVTVRALADGGPGFLDAIAFATQGRRLDVPTVDPFGTPVLGWVLIDAVTAYVESAQACGLHVTTRRDPMTATTFGVGALVAAAVEAGVRSVVIGLGGSATNDGGAGMLAALGAAPVDTGGYVLPYGGAALAYCTGLSGRVRLRDVSLVGASDVDSPLCGPTGASMVYGPQKGATTDQASTLDSALARFAEVLEAALPRCPPGLASLPGAGAAGGLGAAVLACGGRLTSGFDLVSSITGLDRALDECDLVITGEGSFDDQSLRGKVVSGVAGAARDRGLPCFVLAGRVTAGRRGAFVAGVTQSYSLIDYFGDEASALARPAEGLRALAGRLARQWSRREA
jgi:glycerate 2-kinase